MVVGGGLAGCEAAWQLAERGVPVRLVEMKGQERSPAHLIDGLAELVCSNSFRGASLTGAVGLLKEELKRAGSMLMQVAAETAVPAGRALAVDRNRFSGAVEKRLAEHHLVTVERRRLDDLPAEQRAIVATGPLTAGSLADSLASHGAFLHYHDAIAPLVDAESLDQEKVFRASRYEDDEGDAAYVNCPMNEEEYHRFVSELLTADKYPLHDFEHAPFFEGCLPVEEIARRGPMTLAFGPLKPVGLTDPRTGRRPFAVVQLRMEDAQGTAFNLVGFQTRLRQAEQKRVFRMIPGLEGASFDRYGQVHRNSFVNAPALLDDRLRLVAQPNITLAGQLCGVEGYVESIACGLLAGRFVAAETRGEDETPPPDTTALGGLYRHLRRERDGFQPSNVVWSMIQMPPRKRGQGKRQRRELAADQALEALATWLV